LKLASLLAAKSSDEESEQKSARDELQGMFFYAIAGRVECIVQLVFNGFDMSERMLFDVLDNMSGVSLEMIGVFNERVASAGNGIFGHSYKNELTPGTSFANGVYTPLAEVLTRTKLTIMNLLVILIVLMLLLGGGGFYLGGPLVGGGGFGLILLVLLVLFFTGRLGSR
jgi:hypothetical protein